MKFNFQQTHLKTTKKRSNNNVIKVQDMLRLAPHVTHTCDVTLSVHGVWPPLALMLLLTYNTL